jgi:hypothetical protein
VSHCPMPRSLAEQDVLEDRLTRLDEPHVAPLNALVRKLQTARGGSATVPWFDPADGGIYARILALQEAPGARSVQAGIVRARGGGSGIISSDNNDHTAGNFSSARDKAGVPRSWLVSWNIVPWYLGNTTKIATPGQTDLAAASMWTRALLGLLPELVVVMVLGLSAQSGFKKLLAGGSVPRNFIVIPAPHPSPQNMNTRPTAMPRLVEAFETAAADVRRRDADTTARSLTQDAVERQEVRRHLAGRSLPRTPGTVAISGPRARPPSTRA